MQELLQIIIGEIHAGKLIPLVFTAQIAGIVVGGIAENQGIRTGEQVSDLSVDPGKIRGLPEFLPVVSQLDIGYIPVPGQQKGSLRIDDPILLFKNGKAFVCNHIAKGTDLGLTVLTVGTFNIKKNIIHGYKADVPAAGGLPFLKLRKPLSDSLRPESV